MPLDPISYSLIKSKISSINSSSDSDSVNIVYSTTEPTDKDVIWFDLNHDRPRLYNTKNSKWGYLSYIEGYTDFDNNLDGLWTNYIRIPITAPPAESAQYKIEIDGNTVQVYDKNSKRIRTSAEIGVYFWNSVQPDGSDIRVFDETYAQKYFWIETFDYTSRKMVIWVKIDAGQEQMNIAYGNDNCLVSDYNNGDMTFEFFDDFNDGIIDPNKWIKVGNGTVTEVSGYLEIAGPRNAAMVHLFTTKTFSIPCVVETKVMIEPTFDQFSELYIFAQSQEYQTSNNTFNHQIAASHAYANPNCFRFAIVKDGTWTFQTAKSTGQTVGTSTWHRWQLVLNKGIHVLSLNDNGPVVWLPKQNWTSGYMGFKAFRYERCKYDWYFIRKYLLYNVYFGTPTIKKF